MSEEEVKKNILEYLRVHPKVAWAARFNSGVKTNGGRYVRFNTLVGCPDIMGQLRDGRHLSIETKHEGWKGTKDDHEEKQAQHLETVNKNNGLGIFATSLNDVIEALK